MGLLNKLITRFKNPLTKDENVLLQDLCSNYEISDRVVWYYRNKVFGNNEDTYSEIKDKIFRNIILGKIINEIDNVQTFRYGNLIISIDTDSENVFRMDNRHGYCEFSVDVIKRDFLNRRLNIKH